MNILFWSEWETRKNIPFLSGPIYKKYLFHRSSQPAMCWDRDHCHLWAVSISMRVTMTSFSPQKRQHQLKVTVTTLGPSSKQCQHEVTVVSYFSFKQPAPAQGLSDQPYPFRKAAQGCWKAWITFFSRSWYEWEEHLNVTSYDELD